MSVIINIDGKLIGIEQFQLDYISKFYFEKYNKEIIDSDGYETNFK